MLSKKINRFSVSLFSIFLSFFLIWLLLKASYRYDADALLRTFFYEPFRDLGQIKEIFLVFAPFLIGSLAVLICYRAGIINLNISGQMAFSGLMIYICGFYLLGHHLDPVAYADLKESRSQINWLIILFFVGILASVFLSMLIGVFKIYFGVNEVLTGIFLNYIVYYVFRSVIKHPTFNNPGTPDETIVDLGASMAFNYDFAGIFSISLFFALIIFSFIAYTMLYSKFGFQLKIIGEYRSAAGYAGINVNLQTLKIFLFSGILSGIAGIFYYYRYTETSKLLIGDALPSNGFDTIAIVWLSNSSFIALPFVTFLISLIRVQQNAILISEVEGPITEILMGLLILLIAFGNQLYFDNLLRSRVRRSFQNIFRRFSKTQPNSPTQPPLNPPTLNHQKNLPIMKKVKKRKKGET